MSGPRALLLVEHRGGRLEDGVLARRRLGLGAAWRRGGWRRPRLEPARAARRGLEAATAGAERSRRGGRPEAGAGTGAARRPSPWRVARAASPAEVGRRLPASRRRRCRSGLGSRRRRRSAGGAGGRRPRAGAGSTGAGYGGRDADLSEGTSFSGAARSGRGRRSRPARRRRGGASRRVSTCRRQRQPLAVGVQACRRRAPSGRRRSASPARAASGTARSGRARPSRSGPARRGGGLRS